MSLDDSAPLTSVATGSDTVNVSSVSTSDVDEQAAMLSDWAEQYPQISAGSFTSNLHQVQFGKTQVFSETVSQRVHEMGSAWPGSLVLAVVRNAWEPLRWHGRLAGATDVACFSGYPAFDIVVPAGSEILAVAIDSADFHRYAERFRPTKPCVTRPESHNSVRRQLPCPVGDNYLDRLTDM